MAAKTEKGSHEDGGRRPGRKPHPRTQDIIAIYEKRQKDFAEGRSSTPPAITVIGKEVGVHPKTVWVILRKNGSIASDSKTRVERDIQGRVKKYERKDEFVAFLRESVSNVREGGAAIFPTKARLTELFDASANTQWRISKEEGMLDDVQLARELSQQRKFAHRDVQIVAWFTVPPDPEDTTPRTIINACSVFHVDKSQVAKALRDANVYDQIIQKVVDRQKEGFKRKTRETQQRKQQEREEKEASKRVELESSEELAWFLGMITSAGQMAGPADNHTGITFAVSNMDGDVLAALQSSGKRFLKKSGKIYLKKKGDEITFNNLSFVRWLGSFDRDTRAHTLGKKRYEWLLKPPHIKSFLEGIFDARGHIYGKRAYIFTNKKELVSFYLEVLKRFGLDTPLPYYRSDGPEGVVGVVISNKADMSLLGALESKSREKNRQLDALRALKARE